MTIQRATGALPSRAADNLFWVGRYVERAEATLRLVRALINRVADADETAAPMIAAISDAAAAPGAPARPTSRRARPALIARAALQRAAIRRRAADGSPARRARPPRSSATASRPTPGARSTTLVATIDAPLPAGPAESAMFERVDAALRIIASFSGLAQENMTQLAGWRFLELGRRIERAIATCRFVRQFAGLPPTTARSTCCSSSPTARSPTASAT